MVHTDLAAQNVSGALHDRRQHPRYRYSVPLTIRAANGKAMPGISIEISASGLSAIIAESLKLNDTVELEPVAGVKISALVRHNIGKIYGFQFLNLSAAQAQQITETSRRLPLYNGESLGI